MKRILVLLMLLGACRVCPAAHFEHAGGQFWCQVGGWAMDGDESDPAGAPGDQNTMSRFSFDSVHSYASSSVSAAACSQDGQFGAVLDGSTLTITGVVTADGGVTAADGSLNTYGGFSPTQPGVTHGVYYTLVADAGESDGDLATVELTFTAAGSATGPGQVSLGGGMGSSDVIVAVNLPLPNPDPIDAEYIAYSYAGTGAVSSFSINETAVFKVKIGHTIAVFLGGNVSATLNTGAIETTDMSAAAELTLDITNVTPFSAVCEECDLDSSGKVDMGDLAMLAAAWLSEAYPFPPPPPPAPDPGQSCSTAYDLWIGDMAYGYLVAGESVWYEIYPQEAGCYTINLCNSDFDTAVELYDDCDGYIQGFDDNGCDPQSKLEAELSAWHPYSLRIRGKTASDQGNYEITVTQGCSGGSTPVGSDACENAPQISVDQIIQDNTTGATGADETEYCGYEDDDRDLWYLFIAPEEGNYDFVLEYDTMYGTFAGTLATYAECDSESMYNCTETDEGSAYISEWLLQDEVILIRAASYEYSEGEYTLTVYGPF